MRGFHHKNYPLKWGSPCCSVECLAVLKRSMMSGEKNHQYGLKGELNASFKSNTKINIFGYELTRCPDHPFKNCNDFVLTHRLVAEKYLLDITNSVIINGVSYLRPDLDVHHKDFNRLNNLPTNLMVMTRSNHSALHLKLRRDNK
jgi:hypothetical protein